MSENSRISWTTHTFNPWVGCTQVSPACNNCYAMAWAKRSGLVEWGHGKPRRHTSPENWRQPLKWDAQAAASGERPRVFCASLADVFDAEVADEWRWELFGLIRQTPHLDWLLLTKRPNLIRRALPADWGPGWPNVWLGTTVEAQAYTARIEYLQHTPAAVRFLSCEPLLGPLDLAPYLRSRRETVVPVSAYGEAREIEWARVDWVIAGGESGPRRRELDWAWAQTLRDQCVDAGVAFWWKQASALRPGQGELLDGQLWHQLPTSRAAVPA